MRVSRAAIGSKDVGDARDGEKTQRSTEGAVKGALAWLKRRGSKRTRDGMARYGIPSDNDLTSPR
jgi:hypothetical protein